MTETIKTFKHNGNLGDIIFSLPAIITLGGGKLYIDKYAPGIEARPFTDEMIDQIIELLKTQSYLKEVTRYNGEHIDYDLNKFRELFSCYDHIVNWHLKAFGVTFDTSKPWLTNIDGKYVNDIVINNTFRDRDILIDWKVLKGYEKLCVFVGFENEYKRFEKVIGLKIPWYPTKSILELAAIIKGAKLFIGNQSLAFSLAEAMKVPRILEVHHHCPSCMPMSANGRIILTRKILRKTFSITPPPLQRVKEFVGRKNHQVVGFFKRYCH